MDEMEKNLYCTEINLKKNGIETEMLLELYLRTS